MLARRTAVALLAATLVTSAQAAWPERPVRMVVAFPPGSSTDVVTRALAERLSPALGQPVVVENRPGAGGNLATGAVARSPADGLTFLVHSTAVAVNPSLYRNAGYMVEHDLTPVALLADTPNILFVHPSLGVATLPALLDAMRAAGARNEAMAYASSGTGTTPHLGAEALFASLARVPATHVSFGPAQAVTAVVGNQAPIGSTSLPPAVPLVRDGRVVPIAVTSSTRHPALPLVPTVAEQGFPGFDASTWFAVFGPAGLDRAIVERLNREIADALAAPATVARLDQLGFTARPLPPADVARFVASEAWKWAEIVRISGATAE